MIRPIRQSSVLPRLVAPRTAIRRFGGFDSGPAPPKLDKKDQEEFEKLQKQANARAAIDMTEEELQKIADQMAKGKEIDTSSEIRITHPEYRKPYNEFEGAQNPQTGEVGGPKQDPLRHGDYSFNGRVTDF